jgi:rhamnogalacturonan endolyase
MVPTPNRAANIACEKKVLIDSRGVTRGAYRGYGEVYTWTVPASALKAGANTLTVGVFGSGDADFLSANYIVDAIELQKSGA